MQATSFQDYIDRGDTIQDFTKDGECSCCGNCCTDILPTDYQELARIRKYVTQHRIKPIDHHCKEGTVDMTCPFLDLSMRACTIYPVRPKVCRNFICSMSAEEVEAMRNKRLAAGHTFSMRKEIYDDDAHLRSIASILLSLDPIEQKKILGEIKLKQLGQPSCFRQFRTQSNV